jgi:hypothetical protein
MRHSRPAWSLRSVQRDQIIFHPQSSIFDRYEHTAGMSCRPEDAQETLAFLISKKSASFGFPRRIVSSQQPEQ